ncbi:MAG TPA: orotidine-5'-phosphate decarboxylase [Dehalococcoidia bacterium]|nr:orotidine-5'-phosphate decarboxylase [Dehalococcoidia bacterium]
MNFIDKLLNISRKNKSLLCIGLDPNPDLMPKVGILEFNKAIISSTHDLVCAYKPNLAFYEALGIEGLSILEKTIEHIPADIPIIGDAKRGDIGNTAKAYAKALFSTLGFDAATVNPYLGFDSIEPFTSYQDKGVFILCRTSNRGAMDFQDLLNISIEPTPPTARYAVSNLRIQPKEVEVGKPVDITFQLTNVGNVRASYKITLEPLPLYEVVAQKAKEWNIYGNIGLVVGATYPEELKRVRSICPEMCLLIPGIGAQGGDLALAVSYGVDAQGEKAIINVSRQILYASREKDFAQAARNAAEKIRNQINSYLASRPKTK